MNFHRSNRTILELKLKQDIFLSNWSNSSNRTILELKLDIYVCVIY